MIQANKTKTCGKVRHVISGIPKFSFSAFLIYCKNW